MENIIFTKIILTTDGITGCAISYTWCQSVWHQYEGAGLLPYLPNGDTYSMTHIVGPLPCLWCEPGTVSPSWCIMVYLSLRPGVFDKASDPYVDNWYSPLFPLSVRSLTLMYMAYLMFLVRLCNSLPTMGKLSLVLWPVMLAWTKLGGGSPRMFL